MATKARSAAERARDRQRAQADKVRTPPLPPLAGLREGAAELMRLWLPNRQRVDITGAQVTLEHTMENSASSVTVIVADPEHELVEELLDIDEDMILDEGVTLDLDEITYRLLAISIDGQGPPTLTFIDDVAWQLGLYRKRLKVSRNKVTRAGFIHRMIKEARRPPAAWFDAYIPEVNERQPISKAAAADEGKPGNEPGFSSADEITVKGAKASERQRENIAECLREADRLGASDRVLAAVVMAVTQESNGCDPKEMGHGDAAGADSRGPYQQRAPWGPLADRMDPAKSTKMFLTGGAGGQPGWKDKHGSLRNATGNLSHMINDVQVSAHEDAYAQWEDEARRTVKAFDPSDKGATTIRSAKKFEFTRGTTEGAETSWQAIRRLTEEINQTGKAGWHYWVCANTFNFASDERLRAARPALTIKPGLPWLLGRSLEWNANRPVVEMTVRVLAERWGVMPGAVVHAIGMGPGNGRYLVRSVRRSGLTNPEAEVVLQRPIAKPSEPAHEVTERTEENTDSGDKLVDACRAISKQGRSYVYGGGHGTKLDAIAPGDGLDCSSSCSLALKRAGMFDGDSAITSGEFASSWGTSGRGNSFTVWANDSHVWIEFHGAGRSKRFDTSPQGSGEPGPRVRHTDRFDQARFTPRHWKGR
jgi:hypothetical protein